MIVAVTSVIASPSLFLGQLTAHEADAAPRERGNKNNAALATLTRGGSVYAFRAQREALHRYNSGIYPSIELSADFIKFYLHNLLALSPPVTFPTHVLYH